MRRVDRSPLLRAHRLPEHAKVGDPVDTSACGIEPYDGAGRENIAKEFAANEFELVEILDVTRAVRWTKPREGARIRRCLRAQLWGFESQARPQREAIFKVVGLELRAQLKRYGMDIAKWGLEVSGHMRFQRLRRGKNVTCHNFGVVRFATMDRPKQCH